MKASKYNKICVTFKTLCFGNYANVNIFLFNKNPVDKGLIDFKEAKLLIDRTVPCLVNKRDDSKIGLV